VSGLFAIILIAAVIGIFKPYIPNWKRRYFAGIALLSFVLVGIFAPKSAESPVSSDKRQEAEAGSEQVSNQTAAAAVEPQSKWSYSEDKDQMRGDVTKYATVTSDNEVDLDFPYGSVNGAITVRKRAKDGLNIMFSVDKGQILCHNFGDDSYISAKFDEGAVKRYRCTGTSDGSSETAFITNESAFLTNLKKAKQTVIEAEFFQKGNQQFSFQTAGLKWE